MRAPLAAGLVALAVAASLAPALGDEPLPPPQRHEVWSKNRAFCAVLDPRSKTTTVYRVAKDGKRQREWAMYGWFRSAHLADDGKHLVAGYDGLDLVPVNVEMDLVMIYFFKRGELLRFVTLGELVEDRSRLVRTVSHLRWGGYRGLDARGRYIVETVEKRRLAFDVATGQQVNVR